MSSTTQQKILEMLVCEGDGVCLDCGALGVLAPRAMRCPSCSVGFLRARGERIERENREAAQQAAADRRVRLESRRSSIPAKYQAVRWTTPGLERRIKLPRALAQARELVADGSPAIVLTGGAGAGKTTIASAIMHDTIDRALAGDRAALRLGVGALWVSAMGLARARREYKLGGGEAPAVDAAMSATLLVLDDLGQEQDDRDGALTDVIFDRHEREAHTIVTTGLRYHETVKRYGDGIARRLTEPRKVVVKCAEPDPIPADRARAS